MGRGKKFLPPSFSVNIKRFRPGLRREKGSLLGCGGGEDGADALEGEKGEGEEKSRPQSGAYSPKVLAIPIPEPCLGPIGRDAAETSNMEYSFR